MRWTEWRVVPVSEGLVGFSMETCVSWGDAVTATYAMW